MEQQEPKVLVCITSYNRQDNLIGLCAALQDENNQSIIPDIAVFDDCTPNLTIFRGPGIKFIQSPEHRGKEQFWKTWQDIFNYCKEHEYDYYIFLQDDEEPCPNFIEKCIEAYEVAEHPICISPIRTNYSCHEGKSRWGGKTVQWHPGYIDSHYFDCHGIVKRNFFEALDWMVLPIAPTGDPYKSSGVGKQITKRLQEKGLRMCHVWRTLVAFTIDPTDSTMNELERKRHPMYADWRDNEKSVDVHMASLYREGHLLKTLETLVYQPEVNCIYVTLNSYTKPQYEETMAGIKRLVMESGTRIVTRRCGNVKGSNEKLSQLSKSATPYIAFADDDLLYPNDYFLRLIQGCNVNNAAVAFHGGVMNELPTKRYYGGARTMYAWNVTVENDTQVDIMGSGVGLIRREWFSDEEYKALYADAPATSMDDIILSCALSQKGIARYVLAHPSGLIRPKAKHAGDNYVYDRYKNDDAAQVDYINEHLRR